MSANASRSKDTELYDAVEPYGASVRTVTCGACGKRNRVSVGAETAYCGAGSSVLTSERPATVPETGGPGVRANPAAIWGLAVGIMSVFLPLGLLPILAIILSAVGLQKANEKGKGKGPA